MLGVEADLCRGRFWQLQRGRTAIEWIRRRGRLEPVDPRQRALVFAGRIGYAFDRFLFTDNVMFYWTAGGALGRITNNGLAVGPVSIAHCARIPALACLAARAPLA